MTMEIFSPLQLERFRKFDEMRCKKQYHPHKAHDNCHTKGYLRGYIRCSKCKKWLKPDDPNDAKEIAFAKNGRRIHRPCPVHALGSSQFTARPRHRKTRARRRDAFKRY